MKKMAYRCWLLAGGVLVLIGMAVFLGACSGNTAPTAPVTMDTSALPAVPAAAPAVTGAMVEQALCPVMGNAIDKTIFVDYQGRRIYFCCRECPDQFRADPAKYLAVLDRQQTAAGSGTAGTTGNAPATPAPADGHSGHVHGSAAPAATAAKYTCPMHAEVVANAPGSCPKCGMNLVPKQQ